MKDSSLHALRNALHKATVQKKPDEYRRAILDAINVVSDEPDDPHWDVNLLVTTLQHISTGAIAGAREAAKNVLVMAARHAQPLNIFPERVQHVERIEREGKPSENKVVSLGEARAHKDSDARHWSPLDALKALVRDIEAGQINPVAISAWYWHENSDKSTSLHYSAAGLTYEQHVAMLGLAHHKTIADWRRD